MHQKHYLLRKGIRSTSLSVESSLPLLRYLTALSISLATCAFVLQRAGYLDMYDYNYMVFLESPNISSSSSCADLLGPGRDASFPYYSWRPTSSHDGIKVCMCTTTSAGLEQILPWIFYHKSIGVTQFYVFVEGKAALDDVAIVLDSIPGVTRIHRTFEELEEHKDKSRVWDDTTMSQFMNRPCTNQVFIRQSLNMEVASQMALEAGMEWIFHLDSDELLYPSGSHNYTVQELLANVPQYVDVMLIVNYESCVERDDIKDPFCEVSMFKNGPPLHLSEETYYKYERTVRRGNPGYFLTYENGKSGARVQDGLLPAGAHEWYNHRKEVIKLINDEAAILHYSYTRFSDLSSRGKRCKCKPTKEGAKRCFMLKFDGDAFMISSTSTHEEMLDWYNEQVVWYDKELNDELLRAGVFIRINTPMVILQSLKESGFFADVIASAWQNHELKQKSSTQNQSISGRKLGYMS